MKKEAPDYLPEWEKVKETPTKPELIPDTSSKDYKAGYNLAIQGRIAPAVPAWTDQGKADFAQGYKDGQKEKNRKENEELLAKDKAERDRLIEEFGKPVQAIPEKPKVIGAPSRQELMEAEQRKRAVEGKKLRGQVTLFGAVSTSRRLSEFEEKPIIPQQPVKSMADENKAREAKQKAESLLLSRLDAIAEKTRLRRERDNLIGEIE